VAAWRYRQAAEHRSGATPLTPRPNRSGPAVDAVPQRGTRRGLVIAIAGAYQPSGRSLVAAGLACALGMSEQAMLVDADVRLGTTPFTFGLSNGGYGLCHLADRPIDSAEAWDAALTAELQPIGAPSGAMVLAGGAAPRHACAGPGRLVRACGGGVGRPISIRRPGYREPRRSESRRPKEHRYRAMDVALAASILPFRAVHDLTQAEVASVVGATNRTAVTQWESRVNVPSGMHKHELIALLNGKRWKAVRESVAGSAMPPRWEQAVCWYRRASRQIASRNPGRGHSGHNERDARAVLNCGTSSALFAAGPRVAHEHGKSAARRFDCPISGGCRLRATVDGKCKRDHRRPAVFPGSYRALDAA
jgi:DNA-binding transcriptional regulator YiaG